MAADPPAPTVLLVDINLGFLISLSYELHKRGIECLPALTLEEARSTLMHLQLGPDLVSINCAIPGACTFARDVSKRLPKIAIVAIVSEGNECRDCKDALDAAFHDAEVRTPERILYFARIVEVLIAHRGKNHRGEQ